MRTSGFLNTSEGSKYLLCDGSEIPSSYTKLRILMTHTPDLRDRVPQGAGTYTVNTTIEAALPNIKGQGNVSYYEGWTITGPYRVIYSQNRGINPFNNPIDIQHNIDFDASRCSNIYKDDCTTVQPPALAVNFYIKAK